MREVFMVLVKATKDSETGSMPTEQHFASTGKFNEELVKAGMMEAGEGLHPSSRGARVRFSGQAAHRDRRPDRRDQGTGRRLLAVEMRVAAGADRLGQALPQPDARRFGNLDPADLLRRAFSTRP